MVEWSYVCGIYLAKKTNFSKHLISLSIGRVSGDQKIKGNHKPYEDILVLFVQVPKCFYFQIALTHCVTGQLIML